MPGVQFGVQDDDGARGEAPQSGIGEGRRREIGEQGVALRQRQGGAERQAGLGRGERRGGWLVQFGGKPVRA